MSESAERLHGLAAAYGRGSRAYAGVLDPTLRRMAGWTVELADISAGQRVLDLAAGPGAIAREAARVGARVVGADLALGMMVTARSLSRREIGFVVADAEALPLESAVFDAVTCGLSLSHFADVGAVLSEVHRVLRPAGLFVGSSWGPMATDRSYSAALRVYRKRTLNRPRPHASLLDEESWQDSGRGCEIIRRAGFAGVWALSRQLEGVYPTAAAAVEWALAWPLTAGGLERLDPVEQQALRSEARVQVESEGELAWKREVLFYRAVAAKP